MTSHERSGATTFPTAAIATTYQTVTSRYARWGTRPGAVHSVLAQVRLIRPMTRFWFDGVMPLAIFVVLVGGWPQGYEAGVFIGAMVLVHAGLTVLNDLQDKETDLLSSEPLRALRPVARGVITTRNAYIEALVFAGAGVVLAFFASWVTGLIVAAMTLLTLQHELPPARTQSRPVISQLAGVVGLLGIIVAVCSVPVGAYDLGHAIPFLLFVVIYMGVAEMLVKDIRDVDNDAAGGKQTTAVRFGAPRAALMAAVAYIAAAIVWLWFVALTPWLSFWPVIVGGVILAGWVTYTVHAARLLDRAFSKGVCISLHTGSIGVFTAVNLSTMLAVLLS